MIKEICAAPWCGKESARSTGAYRRSIDDEDLCRSCYQYIWSQAKQKGCTMVELWLSPELKPPRGRGKAATICDYPECSEYLSATDTWEVRREIGPYTVCRKHYMRVWRRKRKQKQGGDKNVTMLSIFESILDQHENP